MPDGRLRSMKLNACFFPDDARWMHEPDVTAFAQWGTLLDGRVRGFGCPSAQFALLPDELGNTLVPNGCAPIASQFARWHMRRGVTQPP